MKEDAHLLTSLVLGDALANMRKLSDESIDSLVTDPPAGISFMGSKWDGAKGGRDEWITWLQEILAEALRTLKPGGHALVWALPRTSHWTATAIEDAGFEIRDVITHHFGTGFPKSHNVGNSIDKMLGQPDRGRAIPTASTHLPVGKYKEEKLTGNKVEEFQAKTDEAKPWAGFGTALKPASEHWILARKPLEGTVAAGVLKHGTGALNIDATRIGDEEHIVGGGDESNMFQGGFDPNYVPKTVKGRWPANLMLSHAEGCPVEQLDQGISSRFFYCAKASKKERNAGLEKGNQNTHPTVKPVALMRYLIRLITPPGGTVLDPFMGSGSTGIAAHKEGFSFIGIEQDEAYFKVAEQRIEAKDWGRDDR